MARFALAVKADFVKQVSVSFPGWSVWVRLPWLEDAASLAEFGELVLGY